MNSFSASLVVVALIGACSNLAPKESGTEGTVKAATLKSRKASANPCIVFGAKDEADLKPTKVVDSVAGTLTELEKNVVFASVLSSNLDGSIASLADALDAFKDVEGRGVNAGQVSYFDIDVKGTPVTVLKVTYFPGDNEYGALFRYIPGSAGFESASLLGLVRDGDLSCLVLQN